MEQFEKVSSKRPYVEPMITSCDVTQEAYATGSSPGGRSKWLEYCVFFSCCDKKIFWSHC